MTTRTPLPAFEHDPLPEHTSHFRLIHIVRGDFEQRVECEISAWPIDNAPRYYAISYTWGDPADTTEITVNGRSLVVRRNCEYVLQQAFATGKSEYFWVDAICIAQTTEEKNHQVGIMGQIYSGAEHVLACVGPHENDSQFLSKIIREYRSLFKSIKGLGNGMTLGGYRHNPITRHNRASLRCLLPMKPRTRKRLYRSFYSFMKRPYFKRLWIIQELHLAQRASFCFGVAVEEAEDFLALHNLLDMWCNSVWYYSRSLLVLSSIGLARYTVAYFRTNASRAMRSTFISVETSASLLYFACAAEKQQVQDILLDPSVQCTDPRDRLFGLLSVVGELPENGIKPDYAKDRYQVALEALKLINVSGSIGICVQAKTLCHCFQVTGEEASLRNDLALRSSKPQSWAMSEDTRSVRLSLSYSEWEGFKISSDEKDLVLSAQEHNGCRSLYFAEDPKAISISVPHDTRCGDWCLFYRLPVKGMPLGLVVRESENGRYNVIGQTLHSGYLELPRPYHQYASEYFSSFWYPEDVLLLAWILVELESHDVTEERIREYVNRRICAWDGSSYVKERRD